MRRKLVMAALLLVPLGLSVSGAGIASAHVTSPVQTRSAQHVRLRPDVPGEFDYAWVQNGQPMFNNIPCTPNNTTYIVNVPGPANGTQASNACVDRVWIHQFANNTGKSQCFSPAGDPGNSGAVNFAAQNVQITKNTSTC